MQNPFSLTAINAISKLFFIFIPAYYKALGFYKTASLTISYSSLSSSDAKINDNPLFLTAFITISKSFYNLLEANYNAYPFY